MSTDSAAPQEYVLNFEFPCDNEREASILYDVLRVDKEPPRSSVQKTLSVSKNILQITLRTTNAKNLKPGFNSLLDNILLSKETMKLFGPPVKILIYYTEPKTITTNLFK